MKKEKVSIIIPFIELNNYAYECIENCLALDYPNFDIILLPDDTIKLPEKFKNKKIKIIKTGDVTIAQKRNIGIKAAPKSDYFAFIDSDAYPVKTWLKAGIETFKKDKNIWAVGGPNITPPCEPILKRVVGNALRSFLISGTRAFRKKIAKNRFCNDLPTCNLIVKKDAIRALKGFNKNLVTGEDIEFCSRIIRKGKKIYYNNKVVVYHHNRSLFVPYILQRITYGLSVFKLLKKDFSLYNLILFTPFFILFFFIFGPIFAFLFKILIIYVVSLTSIYLLIILVETIRSILKISEIPLTFVAILLGSISPGIGTLLAGIGIKVNIRKIYKNF